MTSSGLTTSENSLLPRSNLSNCVSLWMDLREKTAITTSVVTNIYASTFNLNLILHTDFGLILTGSLTLAWFSGGSLSAPRSGVLRA